jgi:hypothetical protein
MRGRGDEAARVEGAASVYLYTVRRRLLFGGGREESVIGSVECPVSFSFELDFEEGSSVPKSAMGRDTEAG